MSNPHTHLYNPYAHLEKFEKTEKPAEKNEKQKNIEIEQNFYKLPEIKNLIPKLNELVPSKSEQILDRLLLKYEKNPKKFDFKDSLKKVLLGEKIGAYPISGILLEHNDGTNYIQKEKKQLYENLINNTSKNKENTEINSKNKETIKTPEETINQNQENQETQKINKKFEKITQNKNIEDPKQAIINRLLDNNDFSAETKEILEINKDTKGEINNELLEAITNKNDKKIIEENLKLVPKNREDLVSDNILNFKKDFPDYADIAINGENAKSLKNKKNIDNNEIIAYEKISTCYIKIGNTPEDKEKNFSTAIKTASSILIKDNPNIDKESETFKQAINLIHGENNEKQFEGLTKLIQLNEEGKTENGAIGSKLDKNSKKLGNRKKLIKKGNKIHKQIQNENEKQNKNQEKIKKLKKELDKIKEILKEKPKSGEVMSGGKNEVINNKVPVPESK